MMSMKYYFAALALMLTVSAGAQNPTTTKISPFLLSLVQQNGNNRSLPVDQPIDVLAKWTADADEALLQEQYSFDVLSSIGCVRVIRIPMSQVAALATDPQVVRVEAERAARPMTDLVPGQIHADKVHQGSNNLPQAFTGKNVVVGIVDSGFDYLNPFFDVNGTERTSKTPRVKWAADYMKSQKYLTQEDIIAAQHSSDAATMYHGTHVAGIAAGSVVQDNDWDEATSKSYRGIATEADIAMGAINSEITATGLSSASSIQAFSDIFAYADEQQKPCVINYSMGDAMSFVNNRQLEEESIRTLLEKPGHVLVVASGNAGGTRRLAHKPADLLSGGCGVCFNDYEQYGTYFGIELKVKPTQALTLRYTDGGYQTNKGEVTTTIQELATSFALGTKTISVQQRGQTVDGYQVVYLTAGLTTQFETSERILVTISGEGDAWVYADPLCAQLENIATIENHSLAAEGYSMAWPAMMPEVVTVGNIAHRFQILTMANKYASSGGVVKMTDLTEMESTKGEGYLAKSSSVGPTLTGGVKPDVCAPGVNIVSACNNYTNESTDMAIAAWYIGMLGTQDGDDYYVTLAQTGTSMSAPAVTGTIALWMQAKPELTVADVKDVIAHSSRQPDNELTYPNNQYGYGEIDAYRGLCYILGIDGIQEVSKDQPQQALFRLDGRQLTVSFSNGYQGTATIRIFSTDGRQLLTTTDTTVNLNSLPAGVYAVQLTTGQRETTGSTLIRL